MITREATEFGLPSLKDGFWAQRGEKGIAVASVFLPLGQSRFTFIWLVLW